MKKILLVILLFLIVNIKPVYAHFLKSDRNIGAVLHIDPNDQPIAGSLASFFFDIKDKDNKFALKNCNCRVDIYEGGNIIYSDFVTKDTKNPDSNTASFFYTFPKKDVYQIRLIGTPVGASTFQQFTLNWIFRIDQQADGESATANNNSNFFSVHSTHVVLAGILLIGFLIYYISNSQKSKKKQKKKGGEWKNDKKDLGDIY